MINWEWIADTLSLVRQDLRDQLDRMKDTVDEAYKDKGVQRAIRETLAEISRARDSMFRAMTRVEEIRTAQLMAVACECVPIDVDMVDARGCPVHTAGGLADQAIAEYLDSLPSAGEKECPF